jgi:hypothetical protein
MFHALSVGIVLCCNKLHLPSYNGSSATVTCIIEYVIVALRVALYSDESCLYSEGMREYIISHFRLVFSP